MKKIVYIVIVFLMSCHAKTDKPEIVGLWQNCYLHIEILDNHDNFLISDYIELVFSKDSFFIMYNSLSLDSPWRKWKIENDTIYFYGGDYKNHPTLKWHIIKFSQNKLKANDGNSVFVFYKDSITSNKYHGFDMEEIYQSVFDDFYYRKVDFEKHICIED